MTAYPAETVLTLRQLTDGARLHIGDESTNGECFFRSVTWTRPGEKKRYPIILQTETPLELLKGINERGNHHAEQLTAYQADHREEIGLNFLGEDFCKPLFNLLRTVERTIAQELEEKPDSKALLRVTRQSSRGITGGASADYAPMHWIPIKPNFSCLGFRTDQATHPDGREAALSEFKGLTGRYHLSIQVTSLFCPRTGTGWRLSFALRSIVLMESNPSRLAVFAGVRQQLVKKREPDTDEKPEAGSTMERKPPKRHQSSSEEEAEPSTKKKPPTKKPATPRRPNAPKKPKPPAATQSNDRLAPTAEGLPSAKALVSPTGSTISTSTGGTRVAFKDLAYQRHLAAAAEQSTSSDSEADC
uniref:IRS-type PTB domain-containing protein n=1 Tax=Macrostomum lignano TaxID=282301 RepID=A0A1I8FU10_9PLAT